MHYNTVGELPALLKIITVPDLSLSRGPDVISMSTTYSWGIRQSIPVRSGKRLLDEGYIRGRAGAARPHQYDRK